MPTPERTTLDDIVAAARDLLEAGGPARVTMQAVAERVGVRAPSLYKRVRDRDALLALVGAAIAEDLKARLEASDEGIDGLVRAYRAFAQEQPEGFRFVLGGPTDPAVLARTSEPVLRVARAAVGEEHALDAARLITAWATGFLTMELAGAFRLGGDIDGAFEYGLARLVAAL
jgi:AcrR family transcriptional regulator